MEREGLRGLNPAQRAAVQTLAGPLLVLAGAGTGKTRVVTYRIAELIRRGTPPERILAVTFTKKAAAEMQQRASALLRPAGRARTRGAARPEISTFHSLCVRILRRQIDKLGYPRDFAIYARGEQEGLARAALQEVRAPADSLRPADLLSAISRWKTAAMSPSEAAAGAETDAEHLAAAAFRRYQSRLQALGAVDFDDLLLLTQRLFQKHPAIRRAEAQRFDHVLIDEYQDTNLSQYHIVRGLAMGHRNLCVVGDDDQSIYAWRGADVTHILQFRRDWPDATIVRLEENYRSTAAILEFSNTLITFNKHRHEKRLRPSRRGGARPVILQCPTAEDEAAQVVGDLRRRLAEGVKPGDCAILFRTNEQPRIFETELRKQDVPYVLIGGTSFFDRREVCDLLAYLRLIDDPHQDEALRRVLNTPPRGIGDQVRKRLVGEAASRGMPLWGVLQSAESLSGIAPKAATALKNFCTLLETLRRDAARLSLDRLARSAIDRTGYRAYLARTYPDAQELESREAALEEIVNAAAGYEASRAAGGPRATKKGSAGKGPPPADSWNSNAAALKPFLDELLLSQRDDDKDADAQLSRNSVALMTLHSAKGLEFPHVYLVGMEEGILPHKRSIETDEIDEERRLCYVGLTRAQDRLTLSLALSRRKWGKPRDTHASRFLFEMTGRTEQPQTPGTGNRRLPPKMQRAGPGHVK